MNPYPGLRPFREAETRFFAGRELAFNSLMTRLRLAPLTLMYARSGVGKSSFLSCKIVPNLKETTIVKARNEWGSDAPEALIDRDVEELERADSQAGQRRLLILDQFEDVFKTSGDINRFWDGLAAHVNVPARRVQFLISMREEWLGAWGDSSDYIPESMSALVRLGPLSDAELMKAISLPAEQEGTVKLAPELAQRIVKDLRRPSAFGLGESYVEPGLLQLVCSRLWEEAQRASGTMDLALYERLGRADKMSREFVWKELGLPSPAGFSAEDRLLWVGMTRHLVVAQGIKAVTSPIAMARKLRLEDLGLAGEATASKVAWAHAVQYLKEAPENRGEPPGTLVDWIGRVMSKGTEVGFLKAQGTAFGLATQSDVQVKRTTLVEISHDMLGVIFQQFAVEFEVWIRTRWAILWGLVFGLLVYVPMGVALMMSMDHWWLALLALVAGLVFLVLYLVVAWLMGMLLGLVIHIVSFPILRRFTRGQMPMKEPRGASRALRWLLRKRLR
jgi:hypothetical protein